MFNPFASTPRNRRRDRGFTLDVRTPDDTAAPRRRRSWGWRLVVLAVLGCAAWFGGGALVDLARVNWVYKIEALALRQIPVECDGVVTADEIRRLAGVPLGRNVLTIDPYAVRQKLLRHPRIADARLEVEIPDTLRITVRERLPVARLMLPTVAGSQLFLLVDESGRVVAPFEPGRAPADIIESEAGLPVLAGVTSVGVAPGHTLRHPQSLAALQFLTQFERSPMAGVAAVASVDAGVPGLLHVLTLGGARITLLTGQFERQLLQWYAVHLKGAEIGRAIGTLDLSVAGNPPLRWVESPSPTNEAPVRPNRPPRRTPRRHV